MVAATIDSITLFCANIIIEIGLLLFVFQVNNLEELGIAIKVVTSGVVLLFIFVRIFFFIKEKISKNEQDKNR